MTTTSVNQVEENPTNGLESLGDNYDHEG